MAGEDGKRPVNLFGQHNAREFVRHGQRRERNFLRWRWRKFVGKSLRVAAKENHLARAVIAQVSEPPRELLRSELLAAGVEQHHLAPGSIFNLRSAAGDPSRSS